LIFVTARLIFRVEEDYKQCVEDKINTKYTLSELIFSKKVVKGKTKCE